MHAVLKCERYAMVRPLNIEFKTFSCSLFVDITLRNIHTSIGYDAFWMNGMSLRCDSQLMVKSHCEDMFLNFIRNPSFLQCASALSCGWHLRLILFIQKTSCTLY